MSKISKFSVKKPVTIFMVMIAVVIIGIVSLFNTKTDLFPEINLPYATVTSTYIGASPYEVEQMLTTPIEEALSTVSNVYGVRSIAMSDANVTIIEFVEGTNMDSAIIEMRENLDLIRDSLPEESTNPTIMKLDPSMMPILTFAVSSEEMDIEDFSSFVKKNVTPKIDGTAGVARITTTGDIKTDIVVKLDNEKLENLNTMYDMDLNINAELINNLIGSNNFSMPLGNIELEEGTYLIRVGDKFKSLDEIKNLTIIKNGPLDIKLEDIADVTFENNKSDVYSKLNGNDAIIFNIEKQTDYTTTEVVSSIIETLDNLESEHDELKVDVLMNQGEYIDQSVGSVINNLLYGGILAIFVLLLFLKDIKPTFIIALAIPISVMFAFIMIYFFGISMNIVSMGGLALGIGMLVDNAIVVIENIYRLRNEGHSMKDAAINGSKGVSGAITASTLTTISVFIPIVFAGGLTAEIFKELALTVSFSLIASLVIALTLVPMMSSKILTKKDSKKHGFLEKVINVYEKSLKTAIKHKFIVLASSLVLLIGSFILVINNGFEFIPGAVSNEVSISLESDEVITNENADEISQDILEIEGVDLVSASVTSGLNLMTGATGLNLNVVIDKNSDIRGTIDSIKKLKYDSINLVVTETGADMSQMAGEQISISLYGEDLDLLKDTSINIMDEINKIEGVKELSNGIDTKEEEISIIVSKEAAALNNTSVAEVYGALSGILRGSDYKNNVSISTDNYELIVKDDKLLETFSTSELENIKIPTRNGIVLLKSVAEVKLSPKTMSINRLEGKRLLNITGSIEDGYNVTLVNDSIKEVVEDLNLDESITVDFGGESEEIMEAFAQLALVLVLAVILVYMVMASQFESLVSPFIVMFSLPLAFTGSFILLLITNTKLSIISLIGLIILSGIVVNNAIVLIDYINQLIKEKVKIKDAVVQAGKTRLRPILMTMLTTSLALMAMALGIGEGAEMMAPMAIATIGGLVYSTILTLYIIPIIYLLVHRRKYNG